MAQKSESVLSQPLKINESLAESIEPSINPVRTMGPSLIESIEEENEKSSIIEPKIDTKRKKYRCWRKCQIVTFILAIFSLLMIFAIPSVIHNKIVELAVDQTILSKDNEDLWAHFPGKSEVQITRNFTFFYFENEQNAVLMNEKPIFRQISQYKITQLQDFLDIKYGQKENIVTFIDWLRFQKRTDSKPLTDKVKILNLGAIGYWATLKNSRPTIFLQQGLALLFNSLQTSIIPTLLGQGIHSQFLPDYPTVSSSLFKPAGISDQLSQFIWSDTNYGLSNQNHLSFWVVATTKSYSGQSLTKLSLDALYLKNYYTLTDTQIIYLIKKMHIYIQSLTGILLKNHYCDDIPFEQCTGRYLAVQQLAISRVTSDIPPVPGVTSTDTICRDNSTCTGFYPEINAFYKNVYMPRHNITDPTFSIDPNIVAKWMDYDNNAYDKNLDYNIAEDCLLHIGNLDAIWGNLTKYYQTSQIQYFNHIKKRLRINTNETVVIIEWLQYLVGEFILQSQSKERIGIANLFSSGIYTSFQFLIDNLQPFLLKKLIQKQLTFTNCQMFLGLSLGIDSNNQSVLNICNHYGNNPRNQKLINAIVQICDRKNKQTLQFFKISGVKLTQLQQLCDPNAQNVDSFGYILNLNKKYLNDIYDCSATPSEYCSDYQLAAQQWSSSKITLNVPIVLSDQLISSKTFADWNNKSKPFQYSHFIDKFPQSMRKQFPVFTTQDVFQLMNFDKWFSASAVLRNWKNSQISQYLKRYFRFICIYVSLNGLTTQRTVSQHLFGYDNEYLKAIKDSYAPFGGDPSVHSFISLNDLNVTEKEANLQITLKTGKDNYKDVYNYWRINGSKYLTVPQFFFNGNETQLKFVSPWKINDTFYGTSGKILAPNQFSTNNITLYIPNLQRYGNGPFTDCIQKERFGVSVYQCYVGESFLIINKQTQKYYQSFYAIFNETSVFGLPLFTTKNHFMNCTSNWSTLIDIYNQDKTIKYEETSHWDDTFLLVEPYTGVSFQSTLFLQTNYYHIPDELLPFPYECMLPVFSVYRSGNLTETKVQELFSPLLAGLLFLVICKYLGVAFLVVSVLGLSYCSYRIWKIKNKLQNQKDQRKSTLKSSLLGISNQPHNNDL